VIVASSELYRAYGLTIRSAVPLPELVAGSGTPDVDIAFGTVPEVAGWRQAGRLLFGAPGALRFAPDSHLRLLVTDGRRITVQLAPHLAPDVVRPILLSSGMGAVLHERGVLPLHASVVETERGCVALAGPRGAGKSTLAAFLVSAGGATVSDDICAVVLADGQPRVLPNGERVKLNDDSAAYLGLARHDAERLAGGKLSIALRATATETPKPLRAIFVLAPGATSAVRRLEGSEALSAVVEHTFRPRQVVALGIEREHLARCAAVVATTAVFSLSTVRDLSRLGDAARLIAQSSDAGHGAARSTSHFIAAAQRDGAAHKVSS
jgi:hypothetical protein